MNQIKLLKHFRGKVALVTGAGSGLGRAICIQLASYNARVICTDIDIESAKETIQLIKIKQPAVKAEAFQLDVTNTNQISVVLSKIISKYNIIDFLFNNAGIVVGGEIRDLKMSHWRKVADINLFGFIDCATKTFNHMIERKHGHIVNITSVSGLIEYAAVNATYAVSKHGAVTFSRTLQLEGLDFNIKVTTVCPGTISTEIAHNMEYVNGNDNWRKKAVEFIGNGIESVKAAQIILNHTAKNSKLVILPNSFKLFIKILNWLPVFGKNMALKHIRDFRNNDRQDTPLL
ncbi:MAG: SDR family oxidoreductase [Carboxylicivirga sp.]|jgi:NAD(P)-dependent dehydrogenase (short-subunit alcohol dehydrogenase family)|nr:SDR family oxidoreductase [Carboxylicivirga sp.]